MNISEAFSDSFVHPLCLNHREETQKFAEKAVNTQSSRQMSKSSIFHSHRTSKY